MVPCLTCGIGCNGPRCPTHQHRYGRAHHTRRLNLDGFVQSGAARCPRCYQQIAPGTPWQLDHRPDGTLAPTHRWCNETQASPDAR